MIPEAKPPVDSTNSTQLAVVIPVFNEEGTIRLLVEDLHRLLQAENINHQLIVVNDGSTDKSLEILTMLQLSMPQLHIISQKNSGHGAALLKGYQNSFHSEWVFQTDSDYQYDLKHLVDFWKKKQDYDLLLAERKERNASGARNLATLLLKQVFNFKYGKGLNDVNSPYRLMRTSALQSALAKIPCGTFTPNILIVGYFLRKGFRVYTTGINMKKNASTRKSTMSAHILTGSFKSLLQIFSHTIR